MHHMTVNSVSRLVKVCPPPPLTIANGPVTKENSKYGYILKFLILPVLILVHKLHNWNCVKPFNKLTSV